MPPPPAPRPPKNLSDATAAEIHSTFDRLDRTAKPDPGRVTVRRLSRYEYGNSVRDLLGIDTRAGDDLPPDPYGYGFDSIGDVLSLSPALADKYLKSAERIARIAVPIDSDPWKATMDRYLAERVDQDNQLHLTVDHVFPADGEYRLRSAWYQGLRDGVRVKLRLFLDGEEVANDILTFYYGIDRGLESPKLYIAAGRHRVESWIEVLPEPKYKGNPPYLEYIQVYGPLSQSPATESAAYRRIFACGHGPGKHEPACARRAIEPLARRAYRRPLEPRELDDLLGLVQSVQAKSDSLEQGVRVGLQAILVSPNFLFRVERDIASGERELTARELATRLSYFLWSSLPDDTLAAASTPAQVLSNARRMLASPKSRALAENFSGQWLQTRNLHVLKPDRKKFPDFDSDLRDGMRTETDRFFEAVIREDRGILDFIDAKFTFVNERLAKFYGIEGVTGPEFRRVELDGVQRAGVLGHASVLTVSSYPTRTSPVIRGKWLLENILNAPPPPPPANVPQLDEGAAGMTASLRQQLERHRTNALCASCHGRMDPLGFGLENYDAIGKWRTMDGKFAIDPSGSLPDGRSFSTPAGLRALVRSEHEAFTRGFVEKLMIYALGRGLGPSDRPAIRQIADRVERNGHRISEAILGVAESVPFRKRRAE